MRVSRWGGRLGLCGLLTLLFVWSCREEPPSNFDRNLAPETVITHAPAESTRSYYQVHLYWHGSDPDGVVDYFEYAITDSNKTPGEDDPGFSGFFKTTRTDSLFKLVANQPQILGHRFYVRAVDNEGKTDPTPAWTYFVAEDFNPPIVQFTRGVATWVDRTGNVRTIQIKSSNRNAPTDTIGVGGSISVAWNGFDIDPGGFVTGFEWRLSTDSQFKGGTLADTAAAADFSRPPGSPLTSYFTGSAAVFVRAIDDAGARTNPDSVRSFIVNFGPVAWIVDPLQVSPPIRNVVFTDTETQNVWPSGTTLADSGPRLIQFKYTGFDDARDQSLDPANPSGISGFQWRRLKNGGGIAYQDINDWKSFPEVSDFVSSSPLTSGDYTYLLRAVDELGRAGKPETLRVGVNYPPYFISALYEDPGDGMLKDLWMPAPDGSQADTASIFFPQGTAGDYADFRITFEAKDDHFPPPDKDPLDFNTVVEQELSRISSYSVRLNNARAGFENVPVDSLGNPVPDERFFPVSQESGSGIVSNGLNVVELRARDLSGRIQPLTLVFNAVLE